MTDGSTYGKKDLKNLVMGRELGIQSTQTQNRHTAQGSEVVH